MVSVLFPRNRYLSIPLRSRLFAVVKDVGQVALPAVLPVVHRRHEHAGTARLGRALSPQTLNLAIAIDLVVLEHGQLGLLPLVLDLLRGAVDLLLALLGAAAQAQDEVQRGLLLDVVVGERAAVFELLAGEDETLLVGWDALLVCLYSSAPRNGIFGGNAVRTLNLCLHIVDCVARLDL